MKLHKLFPGAVLTASLALSPLLTFAEDWPQNGGPRANGISLETGINSDWKSHQPPVLWTARQDSSGYAAVTIVGGTVYAVDHKGDKDILRALDLNSGVQRWESPYVDRSSAGHGNTRSYPVFNEGQLYLFSMGCGAHCFDAATGDLLWSRDLGADYGGKGPDFEYSASPTVDDNRVIFLPGAPGASAVALDKHTGATLWQSGDDPSAHATPVLATLHGVKQYIVFNGFGLVSYRAEDGKQLWRHEWYTQHRCNAVQPLVMGNQVFISSGYGVGCAMLEIDANWKVSELWKNKELISRVAHPILHEGYIYCTDETDRLVCLDLKTRKVIWGETGFGPLVGAAWKDGFTCGSGGLIMVDGVLLVVSERSKSLVAVKATPEGYQELGRLNLPLEGRNLFVTPSFSDGKIILRDMRTLYCVDLSALPATPTER